MLGDDACVGHHLHIGQQGQIVLFAIAEALSLSGDAADERMANRLSLLAMGKCREVVGHGSSGARTDRERLLLPPEHLVGGGVYKLYQRLSSHAVGRCVHKARGDDGVVVVPYKAWQVGLHHHRLGSHRLALQQADAHVAVVGQSHEAPCGDGFGQCEAQGNTPGSVGGQRRIEESGLVEVGPGCHGRGCRSCLFGPAGIGGHSSLIVAGRHPAPVNGKWGAESCPALKNPHAKPITVKAEGVSVETVEQQLLHITLFEPWLLGVGDMINMAHGPF